MGRSHAHNRPKERSHTHNRSEERSHAHNRAKRRRTRNPGQRSQESVSQGHSPGGEGGGGGGAVHSVSPVEGGTVQGSVISGNHGDVAPSEPVVSSRDSSNRDVSQETPDDVALETTGAAGGVKSCGHRCEGEGTGQALCCLCSRKSPGAPSSRGPSPSPSEAECPLCTRRLVSEGLTISQSYIKDTTATHHPDNTHHHPDDTHRRPDNSPPSLSSQDDLALSRNRSSKNCVVM